MQLFNRLALLFMVAMLSKACSNPSDQVKDNTVHTPMLTADGPNHVDAVFYNVENLFDTADDPKKRDDDFTPQGRKKWTGTRYKKKILNLVEVITAMNDGGELPFLIGLAEIENEGVLEDLRDKLLAHGADYGIVHEESRDMRGIDMGMLYRKDLFHPSKEEALRIQFKDRGFNSRDILYCAGRVFNGEELHILLNHWPSRREGQQKTEHRRLDAARSLKEKVDELLKKNSDAKILIMGDFNDYPNNKSLTDVLGAAEKASPSNELSNLAYPLELRDMGTYPYKGDWGMLDQAIVSGSLLKDRGLHVAAEGLEIFQRDFMMYYDKKYKESKPNKTYGGDKYYGGYSDHLPIILHLEVQ